MRREAFAASVVRLVAAANNYLKQVTDLEKADGPMASGGYGEPASSCGEARLRFSLMRIRDHDPMAASLAQAYLTYAARAYEQKQRKDPQRAARKQQRLAGASD